MKKAVSHRCVDPGQRIREKHKMRCISAFFLAVGMALLLFVCAGVWQGKNYLLAGILMLLFLFGVVVSLVRSDLWLGLFAAGRIRA